MSKEEKNPEVELSKLNMDKEFDPTIHKVGGSIIKKVTGEDFEIVKFNPTRPVNRWTVLKLSTGLEYIVTDGYVETSTVVEYALQ